MGLPIHRTDKMKSVSVKDVDQHKFVRALAAFFKKSGKVKQPEWADLVKTAVFKELAPFDEDWFLIRMASMARHIYIRSSIGVKTAKRVEKDTNGGRRLTSRASATWTASPRRSSRPRL